MWQIIFYKSNTGDGPVEEYILSLDAVSQAKLARKLDLLEEFGINLGMPNVKPMTKGLYELRVTGKVQVRLLHCFVKDRTIIILHGFTKKSRATPPKELKIALNRKKYIESL